MKPETMFWTVISAFLLVLCIPLIANIHEGWMEGREERLRKKREIRELRRIYGNEK